MNLSAPAAHIDSGLRIWKCACCRQCYCVKRTRRLSNLRVSFQSWILDVNEQGHLSGGHLIVFQPEMLSWIGMRWCCIQSTHYHKTFIYRCCRCTAEDRYLATFFLKHCSSFIQASVQEPRNDPFTNKLVLTQVQYCGILIQPYCRYRY